MSVTVMMIVMRVAFMFWLVVCANMFMMRCRRRSRFIIRLTLTSVVEIGVSALLGWAGLRIMIALIEIGRYTPAISSLINLAVHYLLYGINIAGLFICYDERPVTVLFGSIAGYATNNISMTINNVLGMIIPNAKFISTDPVTVWGVLLWLACNAGVPVAVYYAFARTMNSESGTAALNSRSTLLLFAVIVVVSVTVRSISSYYGSESTLLFIMMSVCLICCNLVILFVQYLLAKKFGERRELEKLIMLGEMKARQYELTKENIEIINMKCHDLRHQILALKDKKPDDDYLEDLGRSVAIYDAYAQTGNEALDVVLTDKNLQCTARGITFTVIADGSLLSFMRPADVYSLFGNALENAVEYVAALPPEKRIIKLFVERAWNGFVSIRVWNGYEGAPPELRGGLPVTTKGDGTIHGYGMKSMKKIAESYGGDFSVRAEDGSFSVNILIPLSGK